MPRGKDSDDAERFTAATTRARHEAVPRRRKGSLPEFVVRETAAAATALVGTVTVAMAETSVERKSGGGHYDHHPLRSPLANRGAFSASYRYFCSAIFRGRECTCS
jgi:hypothetical protein